MASDMMLNPELAHFTKDTKQSKFKALGRKVIDYLHAIGEGLLRVANAADSAGYIQNPYLKGGLKAANTAHALMRKHPKATNFALTTASNIIHKNLRRR
jgi:hypothetical protein